MKLLKRFLRYLKNHKKTTIALFIGLALILFYFRPKPTPPPQTLTVTRGDLTQSVSTSGKIGAKNVVELTFLTGGKLTYVGVKEGDSVTANQTIATVDSRTTQTNLQNALIAYDKQRQVFDQTQSDANGQLQHNEVPKTTDVKMDKTTAINEAVARILQQNQDDLNTAVNSVELQSLAQESSVLTTPIAGIVTRADITSPGVNIAPTSVYEVTDPSSLVFNMDVDESDIGKVQTGQPAEVTLDAFPDDTIKKPVSFIDFVSHATSTGGTAYTVQIPMYDLGRYRVGMDGNAEIITAEKHDVITIPIASVDNNYVYVKNGNKFSKRKVTLGLQNDTNTEVTSGLQVGDIIAVQPSQVAKFVRQ